MCERSLQILTFASNCEHIEKNFMSLNIYFTDQIVSTTTEKLTVTWDLIISSLGGALNFWVGMSVIFAAEHIELVYDVCTVDD